MRIDAPRQSQVKSPFVTSLLIYPLRPTPIIYWIKEDGTLPVNRTFYRNFKKTLQITQVSEADSGNYQCIAKNTLGAVHHTISVTVKGITPSHVHSLAFVQALKLQFNVPLIMLFSNEKFKFISTFMVS